MNESPESPLRQKRGEFEIFLCILHSLHPSSLARHISFLVVFSCEESIISAKLSLLETKEVHRQIGLRQHFRSKYSTAQHYTRLLLLRTVRLATEAYLLGSSCALWELCVLLFRGFLWGRIIYQSQKNANTTVRYNIDHTSIIMCRPSGETEDQGNGTKRVSTSTTPDRRSSSSSPTSVVMESRRNNKNEEAWNYSNKDGDNLTATTSTLRSSSNCNAMFSLIHRLYTILSSSYIRWLIVLIVFCNLSNEYYINRGFTQWFHWFTLIQLFTQSTTLCKFQILSGLGICVGWYSALIYDYIAHDIFGHGLYKNMPLSMVNEMFEYETNNMISLRHSRQLKLYYDASDVHIFDDGSSFLSQINTTCLKTMIISHTLDIIGHPILVYYFWRRYVTYTTTKEITSTTNSDGRRPSSRRQLVRNLFTWPYITSTFLWSRVWSMIHVFYNFYYNNANGEEAMTCFATEGRGGVLQKILQHIYYVGHDIYRLEHLDLWYAAYIGEFVLYMIIIVWKVFICDMGREDEDDFREEENEEVPETKENSDKFITTTSFESKPELVASESCISSSSSLLSS